MMEDTVRNTSSKQFLEHPAQGVEMLFPSGARDYNSFKPTDNRFLERVNRRFIVLLIVNGRTPKPKAAQ